MDGFSVFFVKQKYIFFNQMDCYYQLKNSGGCKSEMLTSPIYHKPLLLGIMMIPTQIVLQFGDNNDVVSITIFFS